MRHIILTGPAGSGKTTLANELLKEYMWINFTDELKKLAVESLVQVKPTTLNEIRRLKEVYRPYLIALGTLIGFDRDPRYIEDALYSWKLNNQPPAIFDNARTPEQVNHLRNTYGFKLVRLTVPVEVQKARLGYLPPSQLESDTLHMKADLILDGRKTVKELADAVKAA